MSKWKWWVYDIEFKCARKGALFIVLTDSEIVQLDLRNRRS